MEDNSLDNDLNHNKKASITKYSSDIVKRSIEDLEKIQSGSLPLNRKLKILLVVDLDFGKFLKGILSYLDYELNTIEARGQLDVIYFELSRTQYEIVILTNTTLTATHIIPLVPEIKKRFPSIRIIVISGDVREDYIKELYDLKIENFLKTPFEVSHLKQVISKETITKNTPYLISKKINSTKKNPEVILDPDGIISIKGNSIPDYASPIYEPIIKWVDQYLKEPASITQINISLDYLNGASKKYLIKILQKVSYVSLKNKKFLINWYYKASEDDILKIGEELASILDVSFNFIRMID